MSRKIMAKEEMAKNIHLKMWKAFAFDPDFFCQEISIARGSSDSKNKWQKRFTFPNTYFLPPRILQ